MKKNYLLGLFVFGSLYSAQYSQFAGTGDVNGQEGWVSFSGTGNTIQIITTASDSGKSLSYSGFSSSMGNRMYITDVGVSPSSDKVNLAFSAAPTSKAYASFLLKVTDVSSMQPNNYGFAPSYFSNFSATSGSTVASTGQVSRLSIRQGSVANTFNLGIVNTTGGTIAVSDVFPTPPADYAINTTYLVVLKYDMTGATLGTTSIFINPTISATEPTPTFSSSAGTSGKQLSLGSLIVRQSTKIGSMEIDEVRLGPTWNSVIGANLAVNDLSKSTKNLISNTLVKDNFKIMTLNNADLKIYSSVGALVKQKQVVPNEIININTLPTGIYIIQINENGKVSSIKIMKE